MAKRVLVVDADVLIVLAQHPSNLAAINAIKAAVDEGGPWELVVAECVKVAYEREKKDAAQSYWSIHKSAIKAFRNLRTVLPDEARIDVMADDLTKKLASSRARFRAQSMP